MKLAVTLLIAGSFIPNAFAAGKGKPLPANADLKPVVVHEQAWLGDLATALEQAAKEKKPVFIDFTGVTCLNCKINEKNIFPKPEVKELFAKYVRVQLYTDTVPEEFYKKAPSEETREKHAAVNQEFQKKIFEVEQLPYYVIVKPDGDGGFVIVGTYDEGKINKLPAFVEFSEEAALGEVGRKMTYSDFKDADISRVFGIHADTARLFESVASIEPKPWLIESLERGKVVGRMNEKARSEVLVTPILLQCRDFLDDRYAIYSGMTLDVDAERGLKGECDFILSRTHPVPMLQAPLMMIVEAKRGDIEGALPQCTAQMIAGNLFNQQRGEVFHFIHGCVTSGEEWQFLRLEDKTLWIEHDRLHLQHLPRILGILVSIIKGNGAN